MSIKHPRARSSARSHALSSAVPRVCSVCGYSRVVQVAHIRPVSSFPATASIREINSDYNLMYLCPNHHCEFDLGYIKETPPSIGELLERAQVPVIETKPQLKPKPRYATGRKAAGKSNVNTTTRSPRARR